uniref:Helitron_like_N domain-containing protein n=1 Tax=Heligmosomoides polygyrus TaxID=6339 RepID=A0A183FRW4_HELPZ
MLNMNCEDVRMKLLKKDWLGFLERLNTNHLRKFNSALAMASIGAQVVPPRGSGPYCFRIHDQIYHCIGPLHPEGGQLRQYEQVYILDTFEAAQERLGKVQNVGCDVMLMETLSRLIADINTYAQAFKMMREVELAEEELARRERRALPKLKMVQSRERGLSRRPYDIPTANEVAAVYVSEDGDIPAPRSLAIHQRGGNLQQLSDIDRKCDPLTYPLFFPTGEDGWHVGLKNTANKRLTQMKYYAYLLSIRDNEWTPLLHGGKLLQQFIVDVYVKIEQNRLHFHRTHQKELHTYRGLADYIAEEAQDLSGLPGRRIVLGSSFKGGPRNMQQSYQDAMAIVARHGKPDVFLTITCNPQWKEIKDNLLPGQLPEHRPDLITRVFNLKLRELCQDLFKRHFLGEKRGLPHCHMLLILKAEFKPRIGTDVDKFCCGEVPNVAEEPELFEAVKKFMVHRRCGSVRPYFTLHERWTMLQEIS